VADGRRILLVEDHQDAAVILRAFLTAKGFDCQVCPDGLAALEALDAFDPFAFILDVGLPKVSGIELAKAIRARSDGSRFVLVGYSGYGKEEDRQRALAAGMDAYFVKPADANEMLAAIERIAATKAR
jgi:DNA-binding response OmpR family regulator